MADEMMDMSTIEQYVNVVIPNLERELVDPNKSNKELVELYNLYVDVLRITAPYNFMVYNMYLELDEDHSNPNKSFYHHRKKHLKEIFEAFNDMEMYNKYDMLLISLAPRTGKTTTGIRFMSWIIGKYPEETQLATSYSDSITQSFYIGVMEIVQSQRFNEVFPQSTLVCQNAKREEIWLKVAKRYPSITFVPIEGSMTGRCECTKYLYCDDLVSGAEQALSPTRLEKLWSLYTVNCKQRKKDGCKEIHVATKWSVHDVVTRLGIENENNPRCKIIDIDCYDENGESNFDYLGGFSTKYYKDLEESMDEISFNALYRQQPIEREGLLYHKDELMYYFNLPSERPDTIIAICDSKNLGKDNVSSIVGYLYSDMIYIEDVVYNNGLPQITRPLVANMWLRHNVVRADVELNNGGNYYAEDLQELIDKGNGNTSVRIFYTSNNKLTKIISYSDYVKKHFIFKDPSKYSKQSEYAKFMKDVFAFTQTGKNKHDDAPDALAMMAQLIQELDAFAVKLLNRRQLNI